MGHGAPGAQMIGGDARPVANLEKSIYIASFLIDGGQLIFSICRINGASDSRDHIG